MDSEATFAPGSFLVRKPSDLTGETPISGSTPSSVVGATAAYALPCPVIVMSDPASNVTSTAVATPANRPPSLPGLTPRTATTTTTERSEPNAPSSASLSRTTETTPLVSANTPSASTTVTPTLAASSSRSEKDVPGNSPMPSAHTRDSLARRDAELDNLRNDMQELLRRVAPVLERLEEPPQHDEPPPDYWAQ
ncbi:hypothetical protein C8Q72DRAFT_463129 [Fomitopsis betulina]|nr:hypothetical protein C8Q72DRAFT_463129 [Fomitopsis betulina]